jgi:hypothetical protein
VFSLDTSFRQDFSSCLVLACFSVLDSETKLAWNRVLKKNCCALSNRHFPAFDDSRCVFCCFFVLFCPVFLCIGLFC